MKCNACNKELNFPEGVLKQLKTCPYCNALLKKQEAASAKPEFLAFLKQLVADYGAEIFLKENVGKLRREVKSYSMQNETNALMELVFSDIFKPVLDNLDSEIGSLKKTLEELIKEISSRTKISLKTLCESFNGVCLAFGSPVTLDCVEEKKEEDISFAIPENAIAHIAQVECLKSIRNANRVEIAIVAGNQVVVGKGDFTVGDKALYVKPGAIVKSTLRYFDFLKDDGYRVRTAYIMGELSSGVAVNVNETNFSNLPLGSDVTNLVVEAQFDVNQNSAQTNEEYLDNQDIRHWKEDKFYNNVYSSNQFKNADSETRNNIRRMAKEEAKMIKGLRKDAGLDSGCYITTAVCEEFGRPDDCYELTALRSFRDNWLAKQPDGEALIKEYYATAPGIVKSIDSLKNRTEIYRFINEKFITKCMSFIESNQLNDCKMTYIKMVNYLKELLK